MSTSDLNNLFYFLFHARRVLQLLASLPSCDECADYACVLDALAAVAWEAARC